MDSPRAAARALLAVAGAVLIIGAIVAIRPSLVKKSGHPTSSPPITYSPTSASTPPATAAVTTAPATAVPATAVTTVPGTTATSAATTPPPTTFPSKGPGALARTGISTDPIYLLALILILAGTTVVWMEERLRLLGLLVAANPRPTKSRYQPQHARRRR